MSEQARTVFARSVGPDSRDRAAERLGRLALVVGLLLVAAAVLRRTAVAAGALPTGGGPWLEAAWVAMAVSSFGLHLGWRQGATPRVLLRAGLAYEAGLALALAWGEQSMLGPLDGPRLSMAALVLTTFPMVVPTHPVARLLTSAAAFATVPASMLLSGGRLTEAGADVLLWLAPTFGAALIGLASTRILYGLEAALGQARRVSGYELLELIGDGGMGEVWRARHHRLIRPAAIKLIRPEKLRAQPERALARFEREAQATASLRSPHVVQLYDFGVTSDGSLYYAMELLEGLDLERWVRRHGPMEEARVVHLLRQASEALAEAHERGLIHRDIKPANLIVGPVGIEPDFLKVVDFGLVELRRPLREAGDGAPWAVHDGAIVGTPGYMAPESVLGDPVDGRADLYGLGAVAHWLLTGRPPFEGQSLLEIAAAQVAREPEPPSRRVPGISPEVDGLVAWCLEKDPARRPPTARALLEALDALPVRASQADRPEAAYSPASQRRARMPSSVV